jgi:hypothetical protein
MTALCVVVSAENSIKNTYTFETEDAQYTVTFNNDNLSEEQQRIVAEKLVLGNDDSTRTYGLGCILFGHDYVYTSANVVTHKVRTSQPRCREDAYDVTYCEDCDYTEETLVDSEYIYCCE